MIDRLAEVRTKFDWACEHNKRWRDAFDTWAEHNDFGVVGQNQPDRWFSVNLVIENPIPDEVGPMYVDAIHNFRAVLDHVVCHLVENSRGICNKSTSFPVVNERKDWPSRVRSDLKGFPSLWRDVIEDAQPFTFGPRFRQHPLYLLHHLDARSKHRKLIPITVSGVELAPIFQTNHPEYQGDIAWEREEDRTPPLVNGVELFRLRPIPPPGLGLDDLRIVEMSQIAKAVFHFGASSDVADVAEIGTPQLPNLGIFVGSVIEALAPAFT